MRPADLARLIALAAMWGGSYLFLRYAVPSMGALLLIELRVVLAGLALLAFVLATGGHVGWRRHWRATSSWERWDSRSRSRSSRRP